MNDSTVLAVSRKPQHSFSKVPQSSVRLIADEGVEGDAHRGRTTQHLYLQRKDPTAPNLTQVHLLPGELLEELRALGFAVDPGELGENVLTSGIDLLTLPKGTLLHLGTEAIVEVTGLRTPCFQVDRFRSGLQAHLWDRRDPLNGQRSRRAGIMGIVRSGGVIHPRDAIVVELPPEPHVPLGPV